jgi:hypothetical protein
VPARSFSLEEAAFALGDLAMAAATCFAIGAAVNTVGTPVAGVTATAMCAALNGPGAVTLGYDLADENPNPYALDPYFE